MNDDNDKQKEGGVAKDQVKTAREAVALSYDGRQAPVITATGKGAVADAIGTLCRSGRCLVYIYIYTARFHFPR